MLAVGKRGRARLAPPSPGAAGSAAGAGNARHPADRRGAAPLGSEYLRREMPQLIEFPALVGEPRAALLAMATVCRAIPEAGEPFRELRARLRAARLWDRDRPLPILRFLRIGGARVTPSEVVRSIAGAGDEDATVAAIVTRLCDCNLLLAKSILEALQQRLYPPDELYKVLDSYAYRGLVPSRPQLDNWLGIALGAGVVRPIGIAVALDKPSPALLARVQGLDPDEFLAEDRPEPEVSLPADGDGDGDGVVAGAASEVDTTAAVLASAGAAAPGALRWVSASGLASPLGRERPVPVSRFAGQAAFADDVLEDTGRRIAAWWNGQSRPQSLALGPDDFGLDPEQWVEAADEVLYRVAVAAALTFRLDTDRDGVRAAYQALDAAGVLTDLYHGTVPEVLPARVDARALMLASLAARRCAESPDLAATLDQKKTAAEAFAALEAALGRGLFRIELFWVLGILGKLGVVRHDDLADFTALPHRLVRDTLFRLGFQASPYAHDGASLVPAAAAARRAAGGAVPADEVLISFALAAGCGYDCANRRGCDFACRERAD